MRLSAWDRRPLAKAYTGSVPIGVQSPPTTMTETAFQPTIEATHNGRAALEADPH